ncbi:MAG: hypothetical protein K6G24_00810 [Lachnospiraceae bacterium]|nr:hypothetical protein [Lachnospiraceae bacterium]
MDAITILKILAIIIFIVVIILRSLGPTKNRKAIDDSIHLLSEQFPARKPEYIPDPGIFDAFKEDCTNPALLTSLAYGILMHCGMKPENLSVVTKTDMGLRRAAGTYSSNGHNSLITIQITPSSRANIIFSVLIHECMHYFLFHSGIRYEDTYKNEILTDTATVYMGFYKYMYDGYIMVGYLRESELKYVDEKLSHTASPQAR